MKPNQSKTNNGRKQKGQARLRSSDGLGGSPETIATKLDAMKETLERLSDAIETGKESAGVLLEVENGKAVIKVCGLNEVWKDEDFMEQVEWIGDHGGPDQRPEEVKIWRDAFLAAAKRCDEILAS